MDEHIDPSIHPQREEMLKEVAAYESLHSLLVQQYFGQYVAIHQGNVVDVDNDLENIIGRIGELYSNQVVLIRKVEKERPPEIQIRSPRLIRKDKL